MKWTKQRRTDKCGVTEWGCEHGIGHPCRTHIQGLQAMNPDRDMSFLGVHGCDRCCEREDFPGRDYDTVTDPFFGAVEANQEKK